MSTAIERIVARVQARTAAVGDVVTPPGSPPAPPVAPPATTIDPQAFADLEEQVAAITDQVDGLMQAAVDDTLDEIDTAMDPAMVAALPPPPPAKPDAEEAKEPAVGDTVTVNGAKYVVTKMSEDDGGTITLREAVADDAPAVPAA